MATNALTYSSPYNYNPTPQQGSGTFGLVPGAIAAPDPYGDLNTAMGGTLPGLNSATLSDIQAGLQGQISQPDLNYMQDQSAGSAAASGMPGSNAMLGTLGGNKSARDIGMMQYQVQQNAIKNYNSTIPTISSTQTVSPALQAQIAATNATNAAAPNPASAAAYAQSLYNQYLQSAKGPGGGTVNSDPTQSLNNAASNLENSPYEQQLNALLLKLYGGSGTSTGTGSGAGTTGSIDQPGYEVSAPNIDTMSGYDPATLMDPYGDYGN